MKKIKEFSANYHDRLKDAVTELKRIFGPDPPKVFVLLGSCGPSKFIDILRNQSGENFKEFNCWKPQNGIKSPVLRSYLPEPEKEGHDGTLFAGEMGEKVLIQQGRAHLYEGHPMHHIVFMIRAVAMWGAKYFFVTSTSHSLSEMYEETEEAETAAHLAVIEDHVNFTNESPLAGIDLSLAGKLKASAINMAKVYDREIIDLAVQKFKSYHLHPYKYLFAKDVSFGTPTEIEYVLYATNANVMGVSLVPEAIAAYQAGMRVCAFTEYVLHRTKHVLPNEHFPEILHGTISLLLAKTNQTESLEKAVMSN